MTTDNRDRWRQLGALLTTRRVDLNPAWTTRKAFCADLGLKKAYRTFSDIESGRRSDYGPPTVRLVEQAYRLKRGAIGDFIAGAPELAVDDDPAPPPAVDPAETAAREWIRANPVEAYREVMRMVVEQPEVRAQLGI